MFRSLRFSFFSFCLADLEVFDLDCNLRLLKRSFRFLPLNCLSWYRLPSLVAAKLQIPTSTPTANLFCDKISGISNVKQIQTSPFFSNKSGSQKRYLLINSCNLG